MLVSILLIVIGFVLLIKGADILVDGSIKIAKKVHIPEIVIGLTIVSIGTSMPELFVSLTSASEGYADMAIGNVLGSNVCNLFLVLGLAAVIKPVTFQRETRLIEIPMCLAFTIIFMIICNIGGGVTRANGIILIALFIVFIAYTIVMAIKGEKFDEEKGAKKEETKETANISVIKNLIYIILGIIGLKFGGDFVVDNAVEIAQRFNVSEKVISVTIIAIGTSLPELVTSATAAFKGDSDIAIGNIIGSSIFNILLIIGTTSIIKPIVYNPTYNFEMIILIFGTLLLSLFPVIPPKNKMDRSNGTVYLLCYFAYMFMLLSS